MIHYRECFFKSGQSYTRYFEHLVHEAVTIIFISPPALEQTFEEGGNELYVSPLRAEPRPMFGLYHGAFVLARTLRAIGHLKKSADYDPIADYVDPSHNNAENTASFEDKPKLVTAS